MKRYARLLFHHFAQIAQVKAKLEVGWPLIQERTCCESKCPGPSALTLLAHPWLGETEYRYTGSVNIESGKEYPDTLGKMEVRAHSYGLLTKVKDETGTEDKALEARDPIPQEGHLDSLLNLDGIFSGQVLL